MEINDFYANLAVNFVGMDDSALAAWLQAALRQALPDQAARAEVYWNHATEEQQGTVACKLGWCHGNPALYDYIARDFNALQDKAAAMLDFKG